MATISSPIKDVKGKHCLYIREFEIEIHNIVPDLDPYKGLQTVLEQCPHRNANEVLGFERALLNPGKDRIPLAAYLD